MAACAIIALVLAAVATSAEGLWTTRLGRPRRVVAVGDDAPWPNFRGAPPNQFGATKVVVPANMSAALRWSWHHPEGQYHATVAGGPLIDAGGSIYLGTTDGIRKLSPKGQVLWHYDQPDRRNNNQPSLYNGKVFGSDQNGVAFALDAEDGRAIWRRKLAFRNGADAGYPAAYDGVFVVGAEEAHIPTAVGGGSSVVYGLDAETGTTLWSFRPSRPTWNFAPLFPGQDNVVFMNVVGDLYSIGLHNGTLLWHTPSESSSSSFSDGGAVLGPEGGVFACSNPGGGDGNEGQKGLLRRHRVSDGTLTWSRSLPQPCNSYPAVGTLRPGARLSVVVAPGSFMGLPGLHGGIMAFDAATGAPLWRFNTPAYTGPAPHFWAKGDTRGFAERSTFNPSHKVCLPAHWSSTNIDGDGFVYAGRCDGYVYGVRPASDLPGESHAESVADIGVDFTSTAGLEVRRWNAEGAALHGAWAFAPGTVAFATCDTLYVFNV